MTSVDELFSRFRCAHRAGRADPSEFLDQVTGTDRLELAALIDHHVKSNPQPRPFDPDAFAGNPLARRIAATVAAKTAAESWPTLLPAARTQAQITRRQLVRRLAEDLGHPDKRDRVAAYYHEMETGRLPGAGVSQRVLDALGRILGLPAERLRAAGRAMTGQASAAPAVFARTAQSPEPTPDTTQAPQEQRRQPDELDELFTGGS